MGGDRRERMDEEETDGGRERIGEKKTVEVVGKG